MSECAEYSHVDTAIPGQPDYSALRELEAIAAAYDPSNPKFRFNYLFLNVVDNPAARLKPDNVDEIQWRGAIHRAGGMDNPDRLWPVQAKGFQDLLARKDAQVWTLIMLIVESKDVQITLLHPGFLGVNNKIGAVKLPEIDCCCSTPIPCCNGESNYTVRVRHPFLKCHGTRPRISTKVESLSIKCTT